MDLKLTGRTALGHRQFEGHWACGGAMVRAAEGVNVCLVARSGDRLEKEGAAIAKETGVKVRTLAADLAQAARARARVPDVSGCRHSGQQCRCHSRPLARRCRRGGVARRLGSQSFRLCRPDAALTAV